MNEEQRLKIDRMRFINNTFSSNLALLAILFNVFYFVSIYKSDVGSYYYNILIGGSIVFNLIFMLTVFLASEGVKSYKTAFIVTDKIEEVRAFILKDLDRSGTVFVGSGLYQGAERKMIYVTLNRSDLVKLKANLRFLDPNAFVNVIESSEIMGNGFKALPTE